MHKKQLIIIWVAVLLFSGCALMQDEPIKKDSSDLRVSGDVTVSSVDRKGF